MGVRGRTDTETLGLVERGQDAGPLLLEAGEGHAAGSGPRAMGICPGQAQDSRSVPARAGHPWSSLHARQHPQALGGRGTTEPTDGSGAVGAGASRVWGSGT